MTISPLLASVQRREKTLYDAVSTPATYLDTKETTTLQKSRRRPTHSRRRRASDWIEDKHTTRLKLVGLLGDVRGLNAQRTRENMERCATRFVAEFCEDGDPNGFRPAWSCNHRLCPWCAAKRSTNYRTKYVRIARAFAKSRPDLTPALLTLTLAHRVGESAAEGRKRVQEAFTRLQRRKVWAKYFGGGHLAAYEVTLSKADGCWHPHIHALVFMRPDPHPTNRDWLMDYGILSDEWLKVTGDSLVVHLAKLSDIEGGIREILKYISKPSDAHKWTPAHVAELLEFRGRRMVTTGGEFKTFAKSYEATAETESQNEVTADADGEPVEFMSPPRKRCSHEGCNAEVFEAFLTPLQLMRAYQSYAHKTSLSADSVQKE